MNPHSSHTQDLNFLKDTVIFACAHGKDRYNGDMVGARYVSVESNPVLFFPLVMFKNYNKDTDKNSYGDCALHSRDA